MRQGGGASLDLILLFSFLFPPVFAFAPSFSSPFCNFSSALLSEIFHLLHAAAVLLLEQSISVSGVLSASHDGGERGGKGGYFVVPGPVSALCHLFSPVYSSLLCFMWVSISGMDKLLL